MKTLLLSCLLLVSFNLLADNKEKEIHHNQKNNSLFKKRMKHFIQFKHNEKHIIVSAKNTSLIEEVYKSNLIPRGAAVLTSSGDLEKVGITGIIHAASGSMGRSGESFNPSIKGISDSIKNSMYISRKIKNNKCVAIPFIGSGIFMHSMGVTKDELSLNIIKSAIESSGGHRAVFVAYSDEDFRIFTSSLRKALKEIKPLKRAFNRITLRKQFENRFKILKGSITDFNLHKCSLIVNAANMEILFGGGLSGFIGSKSKNSDAIDAEGSMAIEEFYKRNLN